MSQPKHEYDYVADTQALMASLGADCSLADEEAVAGYLDANPDLIATLQQAADEIGTRFGPHRLVLDVFRSPEEEFPDSLVVRIETELSPREAVARRASLYDEWWTPYSMRHGHKNIVFSLGRLQ